MSSKCVLLVDDNKKFIESAVKFLSTDNHFSIVGWAFNAAEAFEKIKKFKPDLVLMDFSLPDINGFEATKIIKQEPDSPVVIILSINDNECYMSEAKTFGADGYLSKANFGSDIIRLVENIFRS